jgi:hypothetical protein
MTEHTVQSAIMRFLDLALPGSYRAFAIPNGGRRDRITGAMLKREGVKAGVPDIAIVRDGGSVAFIEVKTKTGRLSNSQAEFRDWCGLNAVPFGVVRNVSDVESFLIDLNVPLKARAAA